jgi:hypothetical protein
MTSLKFRLTNLALAAAAVATLGAGAMNAASASASANDGPWPEPPSCSNETGTCTSIEDQLAYECYFVEDENGIEWCETDLEDMMEISVTPGRVNTFTIAQSTPPPPPVKALTARR